VLSAFLCALVLATPSFALAQSGQTGFKVGTYSGTTSQGLPITLTVSRKAVLSLDFGWRAKCADGLRHVNTISGGGGPIDHGHFAIGGVHILNTGGSFHVNGNLRRASAWGKLSRAGPSAFGTNCLTTGVKWHAHFSDTSAKPPSPPLPSISTTYIGATSQGLPITLTASADAVQSVDFGWTADCADGQTHTNTISAGGGPITNGAFSLSGILNTGGHFQVDGTVSDTTASGTLSRSGPNAFGAFDCSATGVTWKAIALG
jgi:hypothetical protein